MSDGENDKKRRPRLGVSHPTCRPTNADPVVIAFQSEALGEGILDRVRRWGNPVEEKDGYFLVKHKDDKNRTYNNRR